MPERNPKLNRMFYSLIGRGKNPYEYMTPEQLELAGAYLPTAYTPNPGYTTGGATKSTPKSTPTSTNATSKSGKPKGQIFKKDGWVGQHLGDFGNLSNPQFDWNPETGVTGWGKNLGTAWNYGNAAIKGIKAVKGLQNNTKIRDNIGDLQSDIILSANNSPTVWHDLNADQRELLRELQRGTYDSRGDIGDVDGFGVLGDAAMGAISGAPGGIPGMIIGAIGGGLNSVIGDYGDAASRDAAELEALYQAVLESEQYHNEKRKQRAYSALY